MVFNKKLTGQDGFTLMEVMIAITVLAFITIAIVTIQDNSRTTKDRVVEEDKDWLQVETAFSRFQWDFTQIYSPLYFDHEVQIDSYAPEYEQMDQSKTINSSINNNKFKKVSYNGLPIPIIDYKDKTTITFFTTSNRRKVRDMKQSHFAWVQYSLEDNEDAPENSKADQMWVRRFKPEDPFNPEDFNWDETRSQVLLRNIKKLAIEYWHPQRKKWVDNHTTLPDSGQFMIRGIRLKMEWVNKNGFEETFVRVYRPNFPNFEPENMYQLKVPLDPGTGKPIANQFNTGAR